jgi:hypothetical protein
MDDRLSTFDEAETSGHGEARRAMPDAFAQFATSGFRGRIERAETPTEMPPARVLEAEHESAERPEEVGFARAVEDHLQADAFSLPQRFVTICSERY